jgi:hypothetical protein
METILNQVLLAQSVFGKIRLNKMAKEIKK